MADRIDALGNQSRRLRAFRGQVIEDTLDAELQALVRDAARQLEVPIALVSLILDQIQYFRAHHGLPPDLAAVRATSRDTSFCQLVVRDDAPLEVNDAPHDERVPQALVEQYGIRAYLGVPIRIDDEVLGTLCVIDTEPHVFSDADRARLRRLADRVQIALVRLATRRITAPLGLVEASLSPVLATLRNHLVPIYYGIDEARAAVLQIRTCMTAVQMGADTAYLQQNLPNVAGAVATLDRTLRLLGESTDGLLSGVETIERSASTTWQSPKLKAAIDHGTELCDHMIEHIDGVVWQHVDDAPLIGQPLPIVSAIVAAALTLLAERIRAHHMRGPLQGTARIQDGSLALAFWGPGLYEADALELRRHLNRVGVGDEMAQVESLPPRIRVVVPLDAA